MTIKQILKNRTILHYMALVGILGIICYFLHDFIGAKFYPGYDFLSQAVSDLTAINAPSRVIASGLANVYGTFSIISSMAVVLISQNRLNKTMRLGIYLFALMNLISNIGYSLFPLSESGFATSFSDIMHVYVVTVLVVLLSIISLTLITTGSLKQDGLYKSLGILSLVTLLLMMSGAILSNIVPQAIFGLVERFSTYSAVVFTGILGIYGFMSLDYLDQRKIELPKAL